MSVASELTASSEPASLPEARRTLVATGFNHALHDGYTDLIYVLLPVWQAEFGLDYVALALLRSLYNGALAALQMPASRLAQSWAPSPCWCSARSLSAVRLRDRRCLGRPRRARHRAPVRRRPAAPPASPGLGGDRPGLRP